MLGYGRECQMSKAVTPELVCGPGASSMHAELESRQNRSCSDLMAIPETCRVTLRLN